MLPPCPAAARLPPQRLAYCRAPNIISHDLSEWGPVRRCSSSTLTPRCTAGLAATRSTFTDPENHIILPEIISKEPLGPATRQGDAQWSDIITWVLNVTITAEEKGVTSANVDAMKSSKDPEVLRLLGVEGSQGEELGLSKDWAYNIIKAVGNYGEIFERNIGVNTPIGLERGLNALWTNGGLQYSPPFR